MQALVESLPAQYRKDAVWIMNTTVEGDVRALLPATGGSFACPRDGTGGNVEGPPWSYRASWHLTGTIFGTLKAT
jgi:hypothetical protein